MCFMLLRDAHGHVFVIRWRSVSAICTGELHSRVLCVPCSCVILPCAACICCHVAVFERERVQAPHPSWVGAARLAGCAADCDTAGLAKHTFCMHHNLHGCPGMGFDGL
jgi:hypothetical protein